MILSDTFYEFADPLMQQLGRPTLLCHRLLADEDGFVSEYRLRQTDPKRRAVQALQSLNFKVLAAGDSYNDTAMLGAADAGIPHPRAGSDYGAVPAASGAQRLRRAAGGDRCDG